MAYADFAKSFEGDLVTPTDPGYADSIARWASNAVRPAKIVAFVKNEKDVALAIKYAKENTLKFAVKSGGHSSSGASSADGGLVIDLSRYLNTVRVDPVAKLVYAGGGAIWGDVDEAAIEHGLAAVAGTVYHTGVGGLTLGGGMGFLTSAHGMVIDNLVEATIVVADGTTLVANERQNKELFWGIRGGGGNFGVVTQFVYNLHPQLRTVYAGVLIFLPSQLESLLRYCADWHPTAHDKESLYCVLTRGPPPDRNPCVLAIIFFNGSKEEGRANFKELFDIGPVVDQTKEINYEEVNKMSNDAFAPGRPTYLRGSALTKTQYKPIKEAFDRLIALSENPDFDIVLGLEYIPLGKVMKADPDSTAFVRRGLPTVLNIIRWKENTPENQETGRAIAHELIEIITKANVGASDGINLGYGNYDAEGGLPSDVDGYPYSGKAESLFGDHYPRLQALKKQYDPERLFSNWFAITPA